MSQLITDPTRATRMLATLQNNVAVEEVPDTTAEWVFQHPVEAGKEFTLFLKNRAQVLIGKVETITIDRTSAFNPAEFIGKGWTIWKGPANGNGLEGEEEQDTRSLALTTLDVTRLRLETTLKEGEDSIVGEEKLARLQKMTDVIRPDAGIFLTFWKNQHLIPERFKAQTNGNTTYIFCDGTILRSPHGDRYVLCFCWRGDAWGWGCDGLGGVWFADGPSVVSPQVSSQN
ncbi:MAG: hypothetical protein Q7R88_02465 [bacterium]|nr:hypothetical protein [bacterium]